MLLHLCVILFKGGGVSVPACTTGHMTGRSLSRGVSVRQTPRTETSPRTVTSGRYTSYWNAFLFWILLLFVSGSSVIELEDRIMD